MKNSKQNLQKFSKNSTKILEISQKTIWILKKAKDYINNGYNDFICNALHAVVSDYELYESTEEKLAHKIEIWISKVLNDRTYTTWLEDNYPEFYIGSNESCKEGRLQWLDYIIKQVKSGEYVFLKPDEVKV